MTSAKKELAEYRRQIDALDDDIVALLERRTGWAKKIGDIKRAAGEATCMVPEREAEILHRVRAQSDLLKSHIQTIYRELISATTACEQLLSVSYLGPAGTHSHEAALAAFGRAARLSPFSSITAAVREAEKGAVDFAIVPFENSAAGTVGETLDVLSQTPLFITSELIRRIRHNLLAAKRELSLKDIKTVYGHPQALQQCRRWLEKNAPAAVLTATYSTAAAAEIVVAGAVDAVAVGSAMVQREYQLSPLATGIEDFTNNSTRFFMLGGRASLPSAADKTSFIMTARDEAGAMYRLLQPLAENGVTLTKLESRPSQGRLWEYLFFVEVAGHQQDDDVAASLREVGKRAASLKILGSYPHEAE